MSFKEDIKKYNKASKRLEDEKMKYWIIMHGILVDVLWNQYGWRKRHIVNFACCSGEIWHELSSNTNGLISTMEICERETKIEMSMVGLGSYRDQEFLNHEIFNPETNTIPKLTYMTEELIKWLPCVFMSCFITAMHRKEKWGFEKLADLAARMNEQLLNVQSVEYYQTLCKEKYDIELYIEDI